MRRAWNVWAVDGKRIVRPLFLSFDHPSTIDWETCTTYSSTTIVTSSVVKLSAVTYALAPVSFLGVERDHMLISCVFAR